MEKTVTKEFNQYEDFNIGDIVRLKSGGPNMTVEDAFSRIACTWFDEAAILHREEFHQGALEKVQSAEPSPETSPQPAAVG